MTIIEQYIAEHAVGVTADRVTRIRRILHAFEDHAGVPIEQADAEHVVAYMTSLAERYHPNTVRQNLGIIRPFYGWARRKGIVTADVMLSVREIPNPRGSGTGLPRPYKRTEIARFWGELDAAYPFDERFPHWLRRFREGKSPYRRVWRHCARTQLEAVVHLAMHCGLRQGEIYRLELDEVHYDNEYVIVRGAAKGRNAGTEPRYREVPLTEDARRAIRDWLELRVVLLARFGMDHDRVWLTLHPSATPNNPILPSSPAGPMRRNAFRDIVSRIGSGWELHRFRHTCGTEWLRAGMELAHVSRLLGHANIAQTLGYAEIVNTDVHRSAMRHHDAFTRALRPPRKEAA